MKEPVRCYKWFQEESKEQIEMIEIEIEIYHQKY